MQSIFKFPQYLKMFFVAVLFIILNPDFNQNNLSTLPKSTILFLYTDVHRSSPASNCDLR